MSLISKLKQRLNNWKDKAVERADTIRYLRKENNRIKKERDLYKKELKEVKKKLNNNPKPSLSTLQTKKDIVYITLQFPVMSPQFILENGHSRDARPCVSTSIDESSIKPLKC
mgnify:CR=1 FL=1